MTSDQLNLPPIESTVWIPVQDGDVRLHNIARRHYSYRPKKGSMARRVVGPGEYIALLTADCSAAFVWRYGLMWNRDGRALMCSLFRNDGPYLSSALIVDAERWAVRRWGETEAITWVRPSAVQSPNPGYCFLVAGWRKIGKSVDGKEIKLMKRLARQRKVELDR